jgi:hypothetical protein
MATKYVARFNNEIVGKRTSNIGNKTYSHAIVAWGHGKNPHVVAWASRLDLAQTQQRQYQRWGFQAEIVPAEIVPSNKRLASALNESGVFAPFTCVAPSFDDPTAAQRETARRSKDGY